MTVEILRLTGLHGTDAERAADMLLTDRARPDLSRLLVVDDTSALIDHSPVYERLLISRRLDHLLCVAVGPRVEDGGRLRIPASISGAQGSAVIWVSDPLGVDWRLSASAIAKGRVDNSAGGLGHLVESLSADEIFDRVCEIAVQVPGGVASPGLRLAWLHDDVASFADALVVGIRRLIRPVIGPAHADVEPFTALPGIRPGGASLAEDGELSQYRESVVISVGLASYALRRLARATGLLGLGAPSVRAAVIDAGVALGSFRDRVARLLREAHAPHGLTEKQRGQLEAAGVRLPEALTAVGGTGMAGSGRSAVHDAVAEVIRGGDTLPQIAKRLNVTANMLDHGGSAGYLSEVDRLCPPALVRRLTEPPPPPRSRRWWILAVGFFAAATGALASEWNLPAGAGVGMLALVIIVAGAAWWWRLRVRSWQRQLALEEAVRSAADLADLIIAVATREWSGGHATLEEVTRARVTLDGVTRQLTEHVRGVGDLGGGARAARLSESLMPGLRDLVLAVITAVSLTASEGGQETFEQACVKTAELVADWTKYAREHGAFTIPPFGSSIENEAPADDGEMAEIADTVQYDPRDVMWQLCAPADLGALDVADPPHLVVFAPRHTRRSLAAVLPPDTVWTSSGARAGLLRFVALRTGIASWSWIADEQHLELPL
jgi:hypothetical protein